jgi:putative ABC transport system permease protein
MDIRSVFSMSWRVLRRNKMRTLLSMLGITIGIGAVICTVAIGEGGSQQIQDQLLSLGDNLIWVEAGGRNVNGVRTGTGGTKSLTLQDANAIRDSIPTIKKVAPNVDSHTQVVYGNQNWNTSYHGVGPEFLSIRSWGVAEGLPFTEQDVETLSQVCLLGQTVAQKLFGDDDPVGKTIRIGTLPFQVIGVLESKGLSTYGQDQDDLILMPISTAQRKVKGNEWLDDIMCSAASPDVVHATQDQITRLLRQRHRLRPGQPDDFNIRSPEERLQAQEQASHTFTVMLASIASVSLLVGGIGIMNIMLVSVTERTREIGVRMAVGATERDVELQFLSEAVVLSLLGGATGVLFGIFGTMVLSGLLGWPTAVSSKAIIVAALFSGGVGVFFGYYPAKKAARLDPIEALRYE